MARATLPARTVPVAACLAAVLIAALPTPSAAVVPVGPDTQLRTLQFEFTGSESFDADQLRRVITERERGKYVGLRRKLHVLPFIDPVEDAPFVPVELQRDVVRLREYYDRAGFSATEVTYAVDYDAKDDVCDVRFLITEGRPFELRALRVSDASQATPETWLPAELEAEWRTFGDELKRGLGKRLGQSEQKSHEAAVLKWFRDRGYPYAKVTSEVTRDEAAFAAEQHLEVDPGPRARIGTIAVEGSQKIAADVVKDALVQRPGDWYSAKDMQDGQRQVLNLDLFRAVVVEVPPQPQDSTLDVRVRVEDGKRRLITGEAGYLSDAGLTARGEWAHRNFQGGGRILTVQLVGQTGIWAIDEIPDRLARFSVSLTQPHFGHRQLSAVANPFIEFRDDATDQSWAYGLKSTLIYVGRGWVRTASLQYEIDARELLEVRGASDDLDFLSELAQALSVDRTTTSLFTLAANFGMQDQLVNPRQLITVRPSVAVTAPGAWSTTEFARFDLSVGVVRPIGRGFSASVRAAAGRMYPYGKSVAVAPNEDGLRKFLELRDDLFTAGGTTDVRGWGSRLLGPKAPDIDTADTTNLRAERYVPIGGLSRIVGSVELRVPSLLLGESWGTHLFLDGARVWTTDARYLGSDDKYGQEKFFWGTGIGIARNTPVGALSLAVGYMLNPSQLDVLTAQEFLNAQAVNAVDAQPSHWKRRLRLHLSIGTGF
jgi:outer membrane protein insertion porin family